MCPRKLRILLSTPEAGYPHCFSSSRHQVLGLRLLLWQDSSLGQTPCPPGSFRGQDRAEGQLHVNSLISPLSIREMGTNDIALVPSPSSPHLTGNDSLLFVVTKIQQFFAAVRGVK